MKTMKQGYIILGMLCFSITGFAQQDSTVKATVKNAADTTLKPMDEGQDQGRHNWHDWHRMHSNHIKPSNLSTNWLVVDLGFSNFNDRTNYSGAGAQAFAPGSADNWFHLKTNKSVNVDILIFMQRLNMIKHVVNLKYGFGIELNNYRYRDNIKYLTNPTEVIMDTKDYSKNKLAADYFTIPLMLNFNFTPNLRDGFGLSIGASAGYLYSARQKLISDESGKQKEHDDFDLRPWKISWIAELQLGPVKLYGSYATQSMFRKGLDQIPYTVGVRLSNW
ncbi:MAG: outer membrane beta-barrel protein [Bacteroidota bacterium]|nr:outer membrane beta-barrel protein [Bacteroidota bacterium]MDP4214019.1 outer membrane beta-barrel protein [Bacteroidota bacterium]MDP4250243.1 outer membrane beta-barrel protein [Bacteroidota bacterium]